MLTSVFFVALLCCHIVLAQTVKLIRHFAYSARSRYSFCVTALRLTTVPLFPIAFVGDSPKIIPKETETK